MQLHLGDRDALDFVALIERFWNYIETHWIFAIPDASEWDQSASNPGASQLNVIIGKPTTSGASHAAPRCISLITTGRASRKLSNIAPMRPLDENPIMITFHRYRSASLPPPLLSSDASFNSRSWKCLFNFMTCSVLQRIHTMCNIFAFASGLRQ